MKSACGKEQSKSALNILVSRWQHTKQEWGCW